MGDGDGICARVPGRWWITFVDHQGHERVMAVAAKNREAAIKVRTRVQEQEARARQILLSELESSCRSGGPR